MSAGEERAPEDLAAAEAIGALLAERRAGASICPSEAARRLAPDDWRAAMPRIHAAARRMAAAGRLVVLQKGRPVDPSSARGPVRLALPDAAGTGARR